MANVIKCKTFDGQDVEFVDEMIGQGGMKDVYFSPDKSYVVCFFRDKQDFQARERLEMITGKYREGILNQEGGEYWNKLFCWPFALLEHDGRLAVLAHTYSDHFFFEFGSKNDDMLKIKGKEKEGKWFASSSLRSRFIDSRELGDWMSHLKVCILISRAVRRMHMAGLAHSDLSYKNVLIDPSRGNACIIDVDGLVVPGKYPPDVVGTPDFIAPEVVMTNHLSKDDPSRNLPRRETDQHALSVLIYMYLLYRHPLRGGKVHDINDVQRDESLTMGERALFVEHKSDPSNRIKLANVKPSDKPWADTDRIPYTVTGPYLAPLFEQAFVKGLHDPASRPTANDWETALVKTVDLLQPCNNSNCEQKWYVFDNTTKPCCPFCNTPHSGKLPILNLYSSRKEGQFRPDNHRLMVWTGQSLYQWHSNNLVSPNERLTDQQKQRVGYFVLHLGAWWLVNQGLEDMLEINGDNKKPIPIGEKVELTDGKKILLEKVNGGRLVVIQMVNS